MVGTEWLASNLHHPQLRIVDASWYMPSSGRDALAEYNAEHIPGAIYADIDFLSDEDAPYPHTLPPANILAERLGSLGIGIDHTVVVYDGAPQLFSAARLRYMLKFLGHKRVAVLNGGLARWKAEGRPVSSDSVRILPVNFAAEPHMELWRDIDDMKEIVGSGRRVVERSVGSTSDATVEQIVDARSASRFEASEAEPRAGVRGGHMPGARNVHYASLADSNGLMLSRDALRKKFTDTGINLDAPVVCSCGSGVTACVVALGLELAGARDVAVYDGSWTEWGSQPDTPVETGPAKH